MRSRDSSPNRIRGPGLPRANLQLPVPDMLDPTKLMAENLGSIFYKIVYNVHTPQPTVKIRLDQIIEYLNDLTK